MEDPACLVLEWARRWPSSEELSTPSSSSRARNVRGKAGFPIGVSGFVTLGKDHKQAMGNANS